MAGDQQETARNVPKPQFTDAEAGAREFPSSNSRSYNYFEPARQRASVYEDVTVDVQPDPARYLTQGWLYGFADGPGGYPHEWTRLKSSNWHAFRDPNGEWEQTIYRNNANVVRQNTQNLANARSEGVFERFADDWLHVIELHVGAWMHAEHGLGMHVFVPAQRDAPTNMINNAIAVNSIHKLRFAQDLAMYNLELSDVRSDFQDKAHMESWQSGAEWQGVRENVERLTGIRDWAEAVVAANLVFEPLVGELFRSKLVMQVAAQHGDFVTPTIMGLGESDYERDLGYTKTLIELLVNDEAHGDANREVLGEWVATWSAQSLSAAQGLEPLWSLTDNHASFDAAMAEVRERYDAINSGLGIETSQEVAS